MPKVPASLVAAVNVVGPDGELVEIGEPIPPSWPEEFRASLHATGGAAASRKKG